MKTLALHPAAKAELQAAIEELERERPGHGGKFLDEVDVRLAQAVRFPASGARVVGFDSKYDVRRYVVRGFPYVVVAAIVKNERLVMAIAHTHREPGYWKRRLK